MALRNNPGRNQVVINFQPPGQHGRGRQGQNPPPLPPPIVVKYKDIYDASLLRLRKFIEVCFRENKVDLLLGETDTFEYLGDHISDTINGETLLSFCIHNELYFKNTDNNIKYDLGAERPAEKQPGNCPPESNLPNDEKHWPVRFHVAKHLIENGLLINKCNELTGSSCVHTAASRGDLAFLQLLDRYGIEANRRSKDGHLPASLAYNYGHLKCADYLDRKSLNLVCLCRSVIRRNLGRQPGKSIRFLEISKPMKVFLEYENPYPGFEMSVTPQRPFTPEALLTESVPSDRIAEFIQRHATPDFLSNHALQGVSYQGLVQVLNDLYRLQEFIEMECVDEVVKSRYVQFYENPTNNC